MFRAMTIEPVTNGFVVSCGCMKLVTQSLNELVGTINEYYSSLEGARAVEARFAAHPLAAGRPPVVAVNQAEQNCCATAPAPPSVANGWISPYNNC